VGLAILVPLRELDEVAYLRYASVYRNFNSLEDFEGEIARLRALHAGSTSPTQSRLTLAAKN
jgi:transcriptional repressor NrdR